MKRLTVRQQIYVFIGLASVVILLIVFWVILPAVQSIRELQYTITKTHTFLETRYQAMQKVRKSVTALPEVEKDTAIFSEALIHSGRELAFITELEKVAERHHIDQELSASLITETEGRSPMRKQKDRPLYQFSFLNRGSFADHLAYLRELEQLPYYLIIDRLVFEKENKNNKGDMIVRFDGIMYAAHP